MTPERQRLVALSAASRAGALPAVMEVAIDGGLLAALDDGPLRGPDLAARLGLDPRGLDLLLAALDDLDLVRRDGERWTARVSATTATRCRDLWSALPGVLAGGPRPARSDDAASAGSNYAHLVGAIRELYGDAPDRLAAALGIDEDGTEEAMRVLDVAAGSAAWSGAVAAPQHAAATVVALDLPEVIEAAHGFLTDAGLIERYDLIAGDLWTVELDPEFDLVIAAGVCHLHSDERAAALIRRAASWVAPAGRLVVVDPVTGPGPDAALHELSLWLRTEGGRRLVSNRTHQLVDAGLRSVRELELGDGVAASVGTAP